MIITKLTDKKSKGFLSLILILFMSGVFLGFTYRDTSTIRLDDDGIPYDIKLSEQSSFESPQTGLEVTTYVDLNPFEYDDINFDQITASDGQYTDPNYTYLAYSFYLKNTGSSITDIVYYMRFTDAYYWMRDALSILVIEEDTIYTMYQKDLDETSAYEHIEQVSFMNEFLIFRREIKDFKADEVKHFRVIMWMDHQKIDQNKVDPNALLHMELNFRATYAGSLYQNQSLSLSSPKNMWLPLTSICHVSFSLIYNIDDEV